MSAALDGELLPGVVSFLGLDGPRIRSGSHDETGIDRSGQHLKLRFWLSPRYECGSRIILIDNGEHRRIDETGMPLNVGISDSRLVEQREGRLAAHLVQQRPAIFNHCSTQRGPVISDIIGLDSELTRPYRVDISLNHLKQVNSVDNPFEVFRLDHYPERHMGRV